MYIKPVIFTQYSHSFFAWCLGCSRAAMHDIVLSSNIIITDLDFKE